MNKQSPEAKVVHALLCDDARKEANGKDLLIGVYSGSILVKELPTKFTFCIWLELATKGHGQVPLEIRVLDSRGKQITGGRLTLNVKDEGEGSGSVAVPGMPLNIKKEGSIRIQWRNPGSRWKTVLTKEVRLQDG